MKRLKTFLAMIFVDNVILNKNFEVVMHPGNSIFINCLDSTNKRIFQSFKTPFQIQEFLDGIPYIGEDLNRSPLMVMQDRQCHCLDGGLLAALALNEIGLGARLIDLVPAPGIDDDHVLAIFQVEGRFGAVAKSNFAGLRFREPVFYSLRELVMSYFEVFFNIDKVKTLRGYTRPLNLDKFDRFHWQTELSGVNLVVEKLYQKKTVSVITQNAIDHLNLLDDRSYQAGFLGTDKNELFKKGSQHS